MCLIVKSSLKTAKKDLYVVKKVKKMPDGKKNIEHITEAVISMK